LVIPSGPYGGDASEREDSFRSNIQYSRQQLEEPFGPATIVPENLHPETLGIGKPKSPEMPNLPDPTAASGTVSGELPTISGNSRSRFGRNRTDTMVFADIDASGVAFELAAKARAGEFDVDFEHEEPRTAKPATESERDAAENENVNLVRLDSDFEISLDPEEEILDPRTGDATAGKEEPETATPDMEKDEAVVSAIDSGAMDEHIPAPVSEEADEAEPPGSSVNGAIQASQLDQGDIPTPNSPIEESSTVTAPSTTLPSITETSTDDTLVSSLPISENPVVSTKLEDLFSHGHHEAENGKSSPEESVVDVQTGHVAEPENEAPPSPPSVAVA